MYVVTALAVALAALIATQLDPTVKAHRDSTCSRDSQAFLLRDWWYGGIQTGICTLGRCLNYCGKVRIPS